MNRERVTWRYGVLAVILLGFGFVILLRTLHHQVINLDKLNNGYVLETDPAERGIVVDRNGVPLIVNRHYYQIAATPDQITKDEARREVAQQLQNLLGIPYEETYAILTELKGKKFAILADAVTQDQANLLQEYTNHLVNERKGLVPLESVYAKPMARRSYPQAELMSHVTGFVMAYNGGVTGIESYYDKFLPQDGIGLIDTDTASLDTLPDEVRRFLPSPAGKDLVLTVDRTVQWIIREELAKGLDEFGAESGSIIVMEPSTGAILGLVNLPDFDPNRFEEEPLKRFPDPAISAQYEPGSIFKIITIGAALDKNIVEPTTIFTDTGSITVGDRVIFNSNRMAYGAVSVTEALARSLNVVTAQISLKLGSDAFYQYLRLFGFGQATNVDLSGEIAGAVKSPGGEDWSPSDLGTNSFGQGLAVTPLQMITAASAIANHGRMMQPHVVAARVVDGKVQYTKPTAIQQVLRPETAHTLSDMLVEVVDTGNIKASIPGYRIAGKSGTAQIPGKYGYEEDATIVSFVGFAPAEDAQFVVLVKMDRPDFRINQWASNTAAPVFSRVTRRLLDYYGIPPMDLEGPEDKSASAPNNGLEQVIEASTVESPVVEPDRLALEAGETGETTNP